MVWGMRNEEGNYTMLFTLKPCHSRRSSFTSNVSSMALRTILVAATIQSGSLCLAVRRRAIVSFFLVPKASLVSYTVPISVRRNNAEIRRNGLAAWGGGLLPISRSRCKGNNSLSHRYFTGYVNGNPVAGGHFNSLFYGHKVNIA